MLILHFEVNKEGFKLEKKAFKTSLFSVLIFQESSLNTPAVSRKLISSNEWPEGRPIGGSKAGDSFLFEKCGELVQSINDENECQDNKVASKKRSEIGKGQVGKVGICIHKLCDAFEQFVAVATEQFGIITDTLEGVVHQSGL